MRISLLIIISACIIVTVVFLPCGSTSWLPVVAWQKAIRAVQSAHQLLLMEDDRFKKQLRLQYKVKTGCYSTLTTTSTSTTTITTQQYCATLFNVVGACRRRKKLRATLLFDDGLAIQPTETLQ